MTSTSLPNGRTTLAWRESGRGETMVLLHGIPGSSRTWSRVAELLSPRFRVLVPDLLGFGSSPDGSRAPHVFEQAQTLLQDFRALRIDAAHVAGFDFGGPVAVALASIAPGLLTGLTLLSTNVLTDTPVPLPLQVARIPIAGELAFRMMFSRPGLHLMWRNAAVDRVRFPLEEFRDSLDRRGIGTARRIFLASLRHLPALYGPIEAALAEISIPVTVMWGDRDPFFSIATGERTARRIPGARFVVLPGCGHFLPNERAAEVTATIVDSVSESR
ncbi:MAG TPA: alpha/beta hydrolase [Thermoanaerobaculia bacterium]|nr:alpha/beta hydrolase [Thermoanaerobaculia bacterium]